MSSMHSESTGSISEQNPGACVVVAAIREIGSAWRLIVMHNLATDEKRFNELKRSTGANSSTLSRVLDDLRAADLVQRRVEEEPLATYYRLTPKGNELCPVFQELEQWAEEWVDTAE